MDGINGGLNILSCTYSSSGGLPKTALPSTQPAPKCAVPNSNDSPEMSWLWKLLDVLEPTIYLSTDNASINGAFIDCALGEARR